MLARPTHYCSPAQAPHLAGRDYPRDRGPLALVPCVSRTAYRRCADCKDEGTCATRHAMMRVRVRVRDETARILDGTSLADAAAEDLAAA